MVSEIPVDVGRDEARDAAARELSDPAYQNAEPSWLMNVKVSVSVWPFFRPCTSACPLFSA